MKSDPLLSLYQLLSKIVGSLYLFLPLVQLPLQYLANLHWTAVLWIPHGFLYLGYLFVAATLALRSRFSLPRMIVIFLAGLVPFATFIVERGVTRDVQARRQAKGV